MKLIKIESCTNCADRHKTEYLDELNCPLFKCDEYAIIKFAETIHPYCPLEDYQQQKAEWKKPDEIELVEYQEYWILLPNNSVTRSRNLKHGWAPYGNKLNNGDFMVAEIKPPEVPK